MSDRARASPGINNPTTAVQCLDRLHGILRSLVNRSTPVFRVEAVDGVARAWMPQPTFDAGDDSGTRTQFSLALLHSTEDIPVGVSAPESSA